MYPLATIRVMTMRTYPLSAAVVVVCMRLPRLRFLPFQRGKEFLNMIKRQLIYRTLCTNYYRLFGSEKQHEKSTLPTQHRSYVGAVYYSNLLCNQRLLHENIEFCNRSNPDISNTYCDSMQPFFTSTAISQAAAINS